MAALWALFCAIEGQRDKRRWWPIALLLPLLVVWGHAHGSFIFAYAVLAMYIGHWVVIRISQVQTRSWTLRILALVVPLLLFIYLARGNIGLLFLDASYAPDNWKWFQHPMRWILIPIYIVFWIVMVTLKPRLSASGRQITALSIVLVAALFITVITSPFGLDNLTHSEKVSESNLFRQVSEWRRPWLPHAFPPMLRFWWMLGLTAATVLGAWMLGLVCTLTTPPEKRPPEARPLHTTLFDVATVMIGVGMTLWARRFAPMLYIFSAPILLTWIMLFLRPVPLRLKARLRTGLMLAALVGAVLPPLSWLPGARHLPTGLATVLDNTEGLAWRTGRRAHKQLVTLFEKNHPDYGLLERVTRYDLMPSQAFVYLRDNQLKAKVFAEWTQAGRIMFFAPNAKVFIDGRSQQVYDEAHYRKYLRVMSPGNRPSDVFKIFNESRTDMVIMRPSTATLGLYRALRGTPNWILVLQGTNVEPYLMFVRRGSALHKRIGQLARSGLEKRPDTPEALGTLGLLLASTAPRDAQKRASDYERALQCWLGAIRAQPVLGVVWYANITRMYLDSGRMAQARQFVQGQQQILRNPRADLSDTDRKSLTSELGRCTQMIAAYMKRAADRQDQTP